MSETTFRHVFCFSKSDNHRELSIIRGEKISRDGSLRLEIPVISELYGDPKYLARLIKLINFFPSSN